MKTFIIYILTPGSTMIHKKTLTTTIDLTPRELFVADMDALIMKKLTDRYVGKCYQSMLITSITRIIARSLVKMYENMLSGGGMTDVKCEVKGIIYSQGEVIHNCQIKDIQDTHVLAETKHADILIQNDTSNKIISILKVGQYIPVVVSKLMYRINHDMISVIGYPFLPQEREPIYQLITRGFTIEDSEKIDLLFNSIEEEEKLHVKFVKDKRYTFFQDMMSCWRNAQNYEKSAIARNMGFKPVSLRYQDLAQISSGICVSPPEDATINKRLFHTENDDMSSDEKNPIRDLVVEGPLMSFVAPVCIRYLLYMQCLRGFMEAYPTEDSVKNNLVYWQICKSMQR